MTKLQVALDLLSTEDALAILTIVAPHVHVIEIGTPLIKCAGMSVVRCVKAAHPTKEVFADMKTADAGFLEADIAFAAGADIVTVLGSASDETVMGAVDAADEHGKRVVADLIGVRDRIERARTLVELGVAFVEFHAGLDEQSRPGYSIHSLLDDAVAAAVPFSIAGGIDVATIGAVAQAGARVAVAGASIYSAADPAAAASSLSLALSA